MRQSVPVRSRAEHGYTMVELMVVVLIIGLLASIVVPSLQNAIRKTNQAALIADAHDLYKALTNYYADQGSFPARFFPPDRVLNPIDLSPLSTQGYYNKADSLNSKLWRGQMLIYFSFWVSGPNDEYLILLRMKSDLDTFILVAHTGQLPLAWGEPWFDGVYVYDWDKNRFVRTSEAK